MFKQNLYNKPIKRSKLRLYLGKQFFTYKRYIKWYFDDVKYSKDLLDYKLPHLIFTHQTPLIRKLQGVDPALQYNKVNNLKIAASRVSGICIKPGEVFSYWRTIGKPTKRKGYKDGLILNPDGTFGAGIGGGLCQLSNMIYWMALHSPLDVIERYRHSHDIFPDSNRTQPFGSGATCVYNYLDLQIYNGTDNEFQLIVYLTEDNLVGELRSVEPVKYHYEVYEKEHFISSTFWGGYIRNNKIYRRIYENDILTADEYVTENHAIMMYQPLLSSK